MIKRIFITLTSALFAFSGMSQTAVIDLTAEKQVIKGFGGINHPVWYTDLNASERDLCFGNNEGQLGMNVLRIWVSDNKDQWKLDLATAQKAIEHGAIVFATPWNPPSSMTWMDGDQKRINTSKFGEYAQHLNDFVTYMRDNGVELYAISTQNEPDYAHEWCEWTPAESVDFIKGYADKIDCRIMTPESFQYRKDVYDPILNDPTALSKVDIFGTHLYGTTVSNFAYPLFTQKGAGKELWMTEVYTDSKYDANIWDNAVINEKHHALYVAQHIHHAMVTGNFQTYVYWPIRRHYALIHDGTNATTAYSGVSAASAGSVTKRGYCMAQFSKFVRPGYVRVGATENPTSGVYVSAYKKGDDVVIIAINQTATSKSVSFSVPGTQVVSWDPYTTSSSKNVAKGTTVTGGSTFQVTLEAASVTSFVGNAQAGTPTVLLTAPINNESFVAPATVTLSATATDDDGTITKVDFYNGDELIVAKYIAPYSWNWENVAGGTYTIKAIATDNDGNTSSPQTVTITVNPAQAPYGGTAPLITDRIEFENYDIGGNGYAYSDNSDDNTGGATFRMDEDVDIEDCTDTDEGYNVGYATAGEWMEYTVNVPTTGTYNLRLRAACNADGRTISLTTDGTAIATDVEIPNTAGWQAWTDVTVNGIELQAGEQVLRLTMGASDYVNLNYMTFTFVSAPVTTVQLTKGWNLVGCSIKGETAVADALTSIIDNLEVVKDADGFWNAGNMEYLNSLSKLKWGCGYFVKVSADCELTWQTK